MNWFHREKVEPSHPRFASKEYVRTRRGYYAECAFTYLLGLTIADAFLAKYLHNMGMTDAVIGIISSVASFSYLFAVVEVGLNSHVHSLKKATIWSRTLKNVLLLPLYFIPFFSIDKEIKIILIVICLIGSNIAGHIGSDFYMKWVNYFVDHKTRASYFVGNNSISMFASIVYLLLCGYIVDHFEEVDKIETAYLIMGSMMILMGVGAFVSSMMMKDAPKFEGEKSGKTLKQTWTYFKKNKSFLRLILLGFFGTIPGALIGGYLGTYKVQELGISVGTLQVVNTFVLIMEATILPMFAKRVNSASAMKFNRMSMILRALTYLILVFTMPQTYWLMFVYMVLTGIAEASGGGSGTILMFDYLSDEYYVQCMAIRLCFLGIFGFLISLVGAKILATVQANGLELFGMNIYGQQLLALLAVLTYLVPIFYSYRVEKKKNDLEIASERE